MLYAGLNHKKSKSAHQQELKLLVDLLLEQKPVQESMFRELLYPVLEILPQDPFMWIDTLRTLSILSIASGTNAALGQFKAPIADYIQRVKILRSCPKIQLGDAYESFINSCFATSESGHALPRPLNTQSGAAPFEPEGYLSWAQTPMGRYHAELGVLWLLLGQKCNHRDLLSAAIQIGVWEVQASKFDYSPFPGLYCCEVDFDPHELTVWRYLLFASLYRHTHDRKFLAPALQTKALLGNGSESNAFLFYLMTTVEDLGEGASTETHSGSLQDDELQLCGWRDPELSLYFTTTGGGSGLGGFTYKSIEIVTYAPHQYPLNEAQGFGVNTMPKNQLKVAPLFQEGGRAIATKGISRLSNLESQELSPPWNRYREGIPQAAWVEVSQTLKGNVIEIDTLIRQFVNISELAFTFFVKASAVRMDEVEAIPNQLRHFVLDVSRLEIVGENCTIRLFQHVDNIPLEQASVEVIPLGGNRAFWGADFLISFLYKKPEHRNRWTLELA